MITNAKIIVCWLLLLQGILAFGNQPSRCSSTEYLQEKMANDPEILARRLQIENDIIHWLETHNDNRLSQTVITIPCVIFNVYHNNFDSLSQAQLESQIDVLNNDFNATNTDRLPSSHPYFSKIGNAQIIFCIAEIDPNGNRTSGIIRNKTTNNFTNASDIKYTNKNGIDGWPADEYLNIWVSNIAQSQFLGQADFPGIFPVGSRHDGLIVQYNAYGNIGTLLAKYDKGRTATHEIGHWLNLQHIWGDATCGDDEIDDTPTQATSNYDCPTFPHISCSNGPNGDLYMNYMDYTDDACMSMFTNGQAQRMLAVLSTSRSSIVTSNKCSGTTSFLQQKVENIKIYPNPIQNYVNIAGIPSTKFPTIVIDILNILGEKVYSISMAYTSNIQIEMPDVAAGTYIMNIYNDAFSYNQKLTVVR